MSLIAQKLISASGATEETDDDFNLVTALYHFDTTTDNGNNSTFLDSSSESHTVTPGSTPPTQGSFSPFSAEEGKWSASFDGTDDYLQIANSADFNLGSGDFTLEAYVFQTSDASTASNSHNIFNKWNNTSSAKSYAFRITSSSGQKLQFFWSTDGNNNNYITSNDSLTSNQWHHVAVVNNGGTITLYIDGTAQSSTGTAGTLYSASVNLNIGRTDADSGSQYFDGFISNARLVKGTAVYTSNFTPSTSPLTAITNTKLLTCCSNRFRDKSTSAHTITPVSTPKIQPFSPFAPSAAYDPAVNGGSFYGDGSGDYASIAASSDFDVLSNGTFTIDFWFYRTDALGLYADYVGIFNGVSAGVLLYQYSTGFHVYINGSTVFNVTHPNLNEWIHVALTRDGTTLRLFLNGVLQASSTASLGTSNYPLNIAGDSTGRAGLQGYVSDVRVVKGTAVYTSAFTPPTAPSTAITYTEALLSFTNAAMFDQSGTTNAITRANTQLDTSVKKFGTASAEFDGTSDNLHLVNVVPLGTSPFTIEFFFRSNTTSLDSYYRRMYKMAPVTGQDNAWCEICINHSSGSYGSGNNIFMYTPGNTIIGTATPFDNNWHHFALTRDTSNNLKMFVDGTQDGSTVTGFSNNLTQTEHLVGSNDTSGNGDFLGYIDELRLTMKARYTSNFDVPTTAFPDI